MRWLLVGCVVGAACGLVLLGVGLMACMASRAEGCRDHADCSAARILGVAIAAALVGFAMGCAMGWLREA